MKPPSLPFTPRASPWGVVTTVALVALAWWLSDVVLLTFAAVLLALMLHGAARPLTHGLGWPPKLALAVVVTTLLLLLAAGAWFAGASAAQELQALRETVPRAFAALLRWMGEQPLGRWILQMWSDAIAQPGSGSSRAAKWLSSTLNATFSVVGAVALIVVLAVFLAGDAQTYRRGLIRLFAPPVRPIAEQTLTAVRHSLSRWLLGQSISMLTVGVLMAIGLTLLGVPMVLTLAVITALLDFVPYIGAISAGVLVVAVAFTENEQLALQAALLCFAVQQAESYLVQPLVHRWAVRLPPALSLLAVVIFGLMLGLPGVLLAVPLMVVLMTVVQEVYVKAWLEGAPGTVLARSAAPPAVPREHPP
ncbi:MAG: AI-2E family transporter [Betaproteobacteria bacterium]|nr:AI-2E family transporter [Betaproteobacteria bacterium]